MDVDHDNKLSGTVIGAAIAVHRELGPGVEEAAYEDALSAKLSKLNIRHERQEPLPLTYKGVELDCGFRLDLLVEDCLPVELKAVEAVLPVHDAQLLTYMRLGGHPLGLLINFEVPVLKDGVRRKALTKPLTPAAESPAGLRERFDPLSTEVLQASLEVHRALGPGLMRSAYEESLCYELSLRNIDFARKAQLSPCFEGNRLTHAVEIPLVVAGKVPVSCLSVSSLTQLHVSRLLARLRRSQWPYGFLINFNAPLLMDGVRRLTLS